MFKKILTTAAIMLIILAPCYAGVNDSASLIFPETSIGAGARAAAMGDAFTAVADDASVAYWNPAGLAQINNPQISLTYDKWFMDSFYQHLLGALPLAAGTMGADIFYMNFGSFNKVDNNGNVTGSTTPYTVSGLIAYGINIGRGFSIGASVQIINQSIAQVSNIGYGGNIGLFFNTGIFSAALTGKNIGAGQSYSLPANVNLGLAVKAINVQEHSLLISTDAGYLFNDAPDVRIGAEYMFSKIFSIRAGYAYTPGTNNLSGITGITGGAGLNLGSFDFDYAYVPFGDLGTTQMVTLRFGFETPKPPVVQAKAQEAKKPVAPETKKIVKKTDEELSKIFFDGAALENQGKLSAAEAKYIEILKYDSNYADVWKRLGAVYVKMKRKDDAISCFETYLKIKPDDTAVINWLKKNK